MRFTSAAIILFALACAAGCGTGNASRRERLDGQTIMPARGRLPTEPYSPVDQPGQLRYDEARAPRDPDPSAPQSFLRTSPAVARALERAVPPLAEPFDQSTTAPSATRPAASPGAYQTIGGVVAEVNNTPIFADKVVSDLEPVLATRARELDAQQFKAFAAKEIQEQITENINRELEFAAAERLLDQREKDQAWLMAERWRQQETTAAGGSVETVRRRYAEHNRDFDEQVREEYRRSMSQLYYWKKILPRVQVGAADMRQYYDRNRDKEFTVRDAAQFEMIQIDPAKVGGREIAKEKIDDLRARAMGGEDFAALAKFSHRPPLRNSEGELPWWEKGAFALAAVEEAVWKLQPGAVSDVIEEGGRFYIVKLEQKRMGRVVPFEEEATQEKIRAELSRREFVPLRQGMLDDLRKQSIVRTGPAMMQIALEIAMQRYPHWAGK